MVDYKRNTLCLITQLHKLLQRESRARGLTALVVAVVAVVVVVVGVAGTRNIFNY